MNSDIEQFLTQGDQKSTSTMIYSPLKNLNSHSFTDSSNEQPKMTTPTANLPLPTMQPVYDFSSATAALRLGCQDFQRAKAWMFTEFEMLKHGVRNQMDIFYRNHEKDISMLKSSLTECQKKCDVYEKTLKSYLDAKYANKKQPDVKPLSALMVHLFKLENYDIGIVYTVNFAGSSHDFFPIRMAQVEGRNNIPIGDAFAYIVKSSVKLMLPDNASRTRYSMSLHPRKGHLSFPIDIFYDLIDVLLKPLNVDEQTYDYLRVCLIDKVIDNLRDFFNNERVRIRSMETKKVEKAVDDGIQLYCRCPLKTSPEPAAASENHDVDSCPKLSVSPEEPPAKKPRVESPSPLDGDTKNIIL